MVVLSPAALSRRPVLRPLIAMATLLGALAVVIGGAEALCRGLLGAYAAPSLHVAVFFVAYDIAVGGVLLAVVWRRLRRDRSVATLSGDVPPASVLIAAFNEAGDARTTGIVATVRAIAAQSGLAFEILVGDDGSRDGTYEAVVRAFGLEAVSEEAVGSVVRADRSAVVVRAVRLGHAGKGATLNALAARAHHPVLITMDADTTPAPSALAHLASAFTDPKVEAAAGVVSVRNAGSILTRHQYAEYVKNSIVRIGWSGLGGLEQVPGAFAGIRADAFAQAGGFPTDSLTEDYELTYRLVDHGLSKGYVPLVVTVPRAQVFTDVPETFRGFIRQRTRWFAGFLSTLYRFRHLLFRSGAGGFGVMRLPLKLIDAVVPVLAFISLAVVMRGAGSPVLAVSALAMGLFTLRWVWDLFFYGAALHLARELGDADETAKVAPHLAAGWLCTATEVATYMWLKHAAVLRAYGWVVGRVRTWESSREPAGEADTAALYPPAPTVDARLVKEP